MTWRGKSAFTKELEKRGIRQVVASPRRPQTLGKIERFWGTLWRELVETAIFLDLEDARRRIGLFIDYYNFQRTNQGIEGLVPADRFFGAASEVLETLRARVAQNALELARNGLPKRPFYLTGQVGGKSFSIHAAGERVILTDARGVRQEIALEPPVPSGVSDAPLSPESTAPPASPGDSAATGPDGSPVLPASVCPDGSPTDSFGDASSAASAVPGASPLDDVVRELEDFGPSGGEDRGSAGGAP